MFLCLVHLIHQYSDPVVTHGNWTLVFRGLGNIDKSVYDAYTHTSLGHDQPLSPMYTIGCLRLDTNLSCDHHFRSNILNKWSNQTITEVKFGIYKDGVMEKFFLFNGSSSTLLSWFSSANLIDSSWSDLTRSPIRSFSIQGYADPNSVRRMYVQKYDPGCDVDTGWFVCVDKATDWCPWGRKGPTFPRFLYSPANTSACNKDMTAAEIIAIFIKF
ncbi:unnamed protein product [Lymnaea stagnalis]|uniref:Uncharacterized protein n=1 Tax=Lymnaea stagnalis TaxID=6523 RepID=A0AAV2I357_LYMST